MTFSSRTISFSTTTTAHFYPLWEAGGVKLTNTNNLVVRGNYSLSNDGMGLWTDENNINTLYKNNTTNDNTWMGIVHEISYRAVIRNNTVLRNSFGYPYWIAAAGILVAASSDVEVYGNYLDGSAGGIGGMQQNRGSGAYGPHLLQNLWVHEHHHELGRLDRDRPGCRRHRGVHLPQQSLRTQHL